MRAHQDIGEREAFIFLADRFDRKLEGYGYVLMAVMFSFLSLFASFIF